MANSASKATAPNLSTADRLATMIVKQPAPFLQKTWSLLEDHTNSHLITWSPSGDSFIVLQPDAFARELLPTVFKHNNYTSFVRQLNIYGFRKLPAPNQEFCHLCFKRGQPQLLSQICRGGMPSSSPSADGPAAEITNLKSQVDKLSKALTYALAELHRRGFNTLRFDWKELVFVDATKSIRDEGINTWREYGERAGASLPQPAVLAKHDGQHSSAAAKRAAASGSMLHLQNSVEELRGGKGDEGGPPSKVAKLSGAEGGGDPSVHGHAHPHAAHAQHAHMMQPDMSGAVSAPGYSMAPMPPQGVPAMSHGQAMHGGQAVGGHMHGDPAVPGPYMPMHGMPGHVGAVDMSMHVPPQGVPVAGQGPPQPSDDVPAPSDSVGLYDMHDTHLSAPPPASVPMPPLTTHDAASLQHPPPVHAMPAGVPAAADQAGGEPSAQDIAHSSGMVVNQLMGAIQDCESKEEMLSRMKEIVGTHITGAAGGGQGAMPGEVSTDGGMGDVVAGPDAGMHSGMSLDSAGVPDVVLPPPSGSLPETAEAT